MKKKRKFNIPPIPRRLLKLGSVFLISIYIPHIIGMWSLPYKIMDLPGPHPYDWFGSWLVGAISLIAIGLVITIGVVLLVYIFWGFSD